MNSHTVHARRWEHGWELHVEGVGVTQAHKLSGAEEMSRSYIAMMIGVDPDSFDIQLVVEVGGGLDDEVDEVRRMVRAAEEAQRSAADRSKAITRRLSDSGLSGREIAVVLQLSPQRVSQLLNA